MTAKEPTPPGAPAPAPGPTDYGGEPIGLGRGHLEGAHPTYSPDGRVVAFVHSLDDNHIWISSVDGKNLRQLTTDRDPDPGSQTVDRSPAWSPDGSRIAFESGHIWLISPDGSNLTQLTTDPAGNKSPAWSPDGSKIAFVSNRGGSEDIWIMNADGTNPIKVTNGLVSIFSKPAFSPDGRQIVFSSPLGPHVANLMIINADGTGLCQLTAGNFEDRHPHWSTRGIVFSRSGSGHRGLWLIQADGSGLEALPGVPADADHPAWSSDASKIAFDDFEHIYVFDLTKRTIKPLTQLNALSIVIYIKPGVANTISPKSERSIPVAILSAPWFDPVRQIDQSSITFGPTGTEGSAASCIGDDMNEDGVPDLVCQFDVAAAFSAAHTEGILKAKSVKGILFEGRDAVKVLY